MNLLVRANGQSSISIEYKRLSVHISVRTGYTISNAHVTNTPPQMPKTPSIPIKKYANQNTKHTNQNTQYAKIYLRSFVVRQFQIANLFLRIYALFGLKFLQVKRKRWCTKRDKHQVWNWPGLLLLASGLYGKVKRLHRLSPREEMCNNINKGSISLFSSIHLALQIC